MSVIGFAICGSFCNFKAVLPIMSELKDVYGEMLPILSYNAANTDTRFFRANDFRALVAKAAGREPLESIVDTEPIGPKRMVDLLVICPCTGNTLAKLAHGITDTPVTMAAKSHLRIGGKLLIALSTNDALSGTFDSVAGMINRKGIYFVPMRQDDSLKKPYSLSFIPALVLPSAEMAMCSKQLEPVFEAPERG